ncbi:MAG: hypothetical protein EBW05_10525, partial [Betaproteobacteria bacterium]|nr:hypothetical protein [Betaproteobacteria bacterium]
MLERFPPPDSLVSGGRRGGRDSRGRFKRNLGRGALVGVWVDPAHTRRRNTVDLAASAGRVPPGRYMTKGLARFATAWRRSGKTGSTARDAADTPPTVAPLRAVV